MRKKILIVEDNKILSDMYKFKLSIENFDVHIENYSENAVQSYVKFSPDLIVLDIMMPWLNGYDILKILKTQHHADCKILVLSNLNDPKDKQKALDLGADKFILKASLAPSDLVDEIKSMLN